jgi:protocatechuate 3,4-dioxygenase alpha subunit
MSDITPSQTVGPYFAYGLAPHSRCDWSPDKKIYDSKETVGSNLVTPDATGEKIRIEGRITDAMIEIWQADSQGRYASPVDNRARTNALFKGFGRSATDANGTYWFNTVKPGAVPGPDGKPQAPHIVVCIYSRGMLRQIYTRLYFSDEAANAGDAILVLVPEERRGTLIAHKESGEGQTIYRFDIRVQGEGETVFFDI